MGSGASAGECAAAAAGECVFGSVFADMGLLELPCSGHASLCRWLRAWQPGTSRPWQPRPSNGASEAAEGLPQPMRGLPLSRTTLKARYDSGELVRASPPADAKRQR